MAYKDSGGNNPMKDAGWVALFLIIIGIMWFAQGGLVNFPKMEILKDFPGSSSSQNNNNDSQNNNQNSSSSGSSSLPESSYKGRISLKEYGASETDPQKEYLEIRSNYNMDQVSISNWTLKNQNISFVISSGSKLPYLSQINSQEPIVLQPNSKIIVTTGKSPIGTSFQLNTCTGYFNQFYAFSPSLNEECPYIYEKDLPKNYPDACFDFVKGLIRCRMPMSGVPMGAGNDCANFISEKANYSGCVNAHKNEEDFYKKEWRVYLNRDQEIWRKRDIIQLIDSEGKLVDEVSY